MAINTNPFRSDEARNGEEHLIATTMPSPLPSSSPRQDVPSSKLKMLNPTECKEWMKCGAWTLCATVMLVFAATGIFHFYVMTATAHRKLTLLLYLSNKCMLVSLKYNEFVAPCLLQLLNAMNAFLLLE